MPSFPEAAPSFTFCKAIGYVHEHGVTHGYGDGLYHPERACKRGITKW